MTIIKFSKDGKAIVKKKLDEAVVPLTPQEPEAAAHTVHIDVLPSNRTKKCVNIFLLVLALMVLAAGIVGGVYLYKYLAHTHKSTHIRVQYQDSVTTAATQTGEEPKFFRWCGVEEDVQIEVEQQLEKIEVPKFDECKSSVVIHDFHMNLTVIVDNEDRECFIMDLDRKKISPPKTFADLIAKYSRGYYMPKVEVVRRDYTVVTPKLQDLKFAGNAIRGECLGYDSYRLEKKSLRPKVFEVRFKLTKVYGYSDLQTLMKDQIYRSD